LFRRDGRNRKARLLQELVQPGGILLREGDLHGVLRLKGHVLDLCLTRKKFHRGQPALERHPHDALVRPQKFPHFARRHELSVIDHEDRAAKLLHLRHQMAGDKNGQPLLLHLLAQEREDFTRALRVQAIGWLVEDEQARAAQQSASDAKTLFHARRIDSHPVVLPLRQAHSFQHPFNFPR